MTKIINALFALLISGAINPVWVGTANAAPLQNYQPGPRLIDGTQLNKMVSVVNGLTGNSGTPSTGYFSANTGTGPTALTGTVLQVVGANSATARVEVDAFAGVPIFSANRFNGTKASPTAILSGDQLGSFNFHGSKTTALTYGPAARYTAYATENWSSTAGGSKLTFSVTPNTTQTLTDAWAIDQDQTLISAVAAAVIKGQPAAQGGSLAVTGGTSSTTGNAGGAVSVNGGTAGATGVGGAITLTAAAGGVTSGNGGAITITGGAGTASNATGGANSVIGGAGQGSAAGGAAVLTGGLAGATGTGGAITIASGAGGATSGAGGAVTITAGASTTSGAGASITLTAAAGVGSTNGGGSVNLVAGAAAGGGIPGTVQIAGNNALECASYYFTGTPAATDTVFFIATRPYLVVTASEIHSAAAGGASALQLVKDTGTDAPGAGSDLLTNNTNTGFDLSATANTIQSGTLTATVATKTLAAGNRLSVDFANAIQSSAGVVVTACMAPI